MVIDADALNAIAGQPEKLHGRTAPCIITPHPGEFARLLQTDVKTVQAKRRELAVEFALKRNLIVILKGRGTIVTDGRRVYVNMTGNPGMATGGTGDILTGLIAALLGQHLLPFEAAQLGVYVHGLAGDLAGPDRRSQLDRHRPARFPAAGADGASKREKAESRFTFLFLLSIFYLVMHLSLDRENSWICSARIARVASPFRIAVRGRWRAVRCARSNS